MPAKARADLGEWIAHGEAPERAIREQMLLVRTRGIDARRLIISGVNSKITDDRPFNEYFWLRNTLLNPPVLILMLSVVLNMVACLTGVVAVLSPADLR